MEKQKITKRFAATSTALYVKPICLWLLFQTWSDSQDKNTTVHFCGDFTSVHCTYGAAIFNSEPICQLMHSKWKKYTFWERIVDGSLKNRHCECVNHILWSASGHSVLPLSPLLFLSTSRKQLFFINSLLTMHHRAGDLLEGLWTVLFGHPLPFDVQGCRKTTSGAPQRGAAAVGVNICVRSHLLLDNMRRYCRTDRDVKISRRKLPFFSI